MRCHTLQETCESPPLSALQLKQTELGALRFPRSHHQQSQHDSGVPPNK